MTTTVYDRLNRVVTSDSRWSVDLSPKGYDGHVLYIDDTGFGKIANRNDFVMLLAGNGHLIEQWKIWWSGDLLEQEPPVVLPTGQSINLYIVKKSTNEVVFEKGQKLIVRDTTTDELFAVFTGSGSGVAAQNWMDNHCARTAIDESKIYDPYTGGEVRYIDFDTGRNLLEESVLSINVVNEALLQRGLIMDTKNPQSPHVSISAQEVADVRQMLINGSITPCAPVGKQTPDWDQKSKSRLASAIQRIREEEAAS